MTGTAADRAFEGLASRIDAMGLRCVGFTSAVFGEGVSTIALGSAFALAGLRSESVLLVDANWLQPSLTADAGLVSAPGLADMLAGKADFSTTLRKTSRSGLSFMPIGDRKLARPALRSLARFLAGDAASFQTVIVDLPPVLGGEALVLPWASLIDRLCMVLREAATPLPVVRQALARIGQATSTQVVLNRADPSIDLLAPVLKAARA